MFLRERICVGGLGKLLLPAPAETPAHDAGDQSRGLAGACAGFQSLLRRMNFPEWAASNSFR